MVVLLAQFQHLQEVWMRQFLASVGIERRVVELEQRTSAFGLEYDSLDVEVAGGAVTRMRDDVDMWIGDGSEECRCVLRARTIFIAKTM